MLYLESMIDWEHRISEYLKEAIQSPHREVEVCEELCEFVMELIQDEQAIGTQKMREAVALVKSCWRPGETPEPYL
jgi:mannitol/fructose-specific phosphotransferase system IIA component